MFLVERKVDEVFVLFGEGEFLVLEFVDGNGGVEGLNEYVIKQLENVLVECKVRLVVYLFEVV